MNVLITGGAGFIGSHLAEHLIDAGHDVLVLDDLSTGQMANLSNVVGHKRFHYRIGSATDLPLVAEMVDLADVTVHLAAAVGVRLIVERPVHTIETNVHGTETILTSAAKKQRPVIVASTSEVYGKSAKIRFSEDDDVTLGATVHSRWAYACSKALDEWLALAYWHERGVPVTICRFFNTVGPRQIGRYGMVLPTLVAQALRQQPLTVFGTGEQTRCFAHVRDVVECITRLMMAPAAIGEVFNIGSDHEVSINALAETVRRITGSSSPIRHIPYDQAYAKGFEDMQRRVPDCSKLERTVGFKPTTPLEEIIRHVVDDQRMRLGVGV
jgi:UDP-glucose 4-epimerase